jgi:hypothetical protein
MGVPTGFVPLKNGQSPTRPNAEAESGETETK